MKLETAETTLRRQKNSQDSVIITNDASIPADLRQYEGRRRALGEAFPGAAKDLAVALERAVKSSVPLHTAIRHYFADGNTIEGVKIKDAFISGSVDKKPMYKP
jgi:hypothetical protein